MLILRKIKELKGYRFFQNFKWDESGCKLFNQNNLIYGWNGSGKTTLCDFSKLCIFYMISRNILTIYLSLATMLIHLSICYSYETYYTFVNIPFVCLHALKFFQLPPDPLFIKVGRKVYLINNNFMLNSTIQEGWCCCYYRPLRITPQAIFLPALPAG